MWISNQHFTCGVAWRGKTLGNYTQFPESVNGSTPEACILHPIHRKTVLKNYAEQYLSIVLESGSCVHFHRELPLHALLTSLIADGRMPLLHHMYQEA
jgi:hypothetical protein